MRCSLLVAAAVAPLFFVSVTEASAQYRFGGGGFRAGGFHGGGFYGRGIGVRSYGVRPAYPGWRGGWGGGWRGAGFYPRGSYYWGGRYPYRRYGGYYPYWGLASGLATAAVIGAATAYPAYDYGYRAYDYGDPVYDYPVYPAYEAVPSVAGGQCSTPVKICTLYQPAPLGIGCSCRVPGGHARGSVIGP